MKGDKTPLLRNECSYSVLLLRPFLQRWESTPIGQTDIVQKLITLDDEERVPVRQVLRWLELAVKVTGDPDMGLRAASAMGRGAGDALEFAARPPPTSKRRCSWCFATSAS